MSDLFSAMIWIFMPVLVAAGAALMTAFLMQARAELAVARQRETLAEARALLATQHRAMEERIKATEEEARRKALDEFMADIRVEERQYVRENQSMLSDRNSLILRERICFRNIPLTNWVEHELAGATAVAPAASPVDDRPLLRSATCSTAASGWQPQSGMRRRVAAPKAAAARS